MVVCSLKVADSLKNATRMTCETKVIGIPRHFVFQGANSILIHIHMAQYNIRPSGKHKAETA